MAIIPKIPIVFNIIFLCCTVFATETSKCDCDIFQISYSEDQNFYYRNFTKQTAKVNGQPFYFSFDDIIFWNEENNSWMGHQG